MRIHVDVEQDPFGAPAPQRLRLGARDVAVAERVDRWDGAAYRYYKLIGDDGCLYIVRLDEPHDAWRLVMFRAREEEPGARRRPPAHRLRLNRV